MTSAPFARYRQVAERLRTAIVSGEYEPGQALPSEETLAREYGLNRTTINKAVRLLATEGLVVIEHGRGTRVRERRPVIHTSASYVTKQGDGERAQWSSELQHQGFTGGQDIREVATTPAPLDIADLLGLEDGDEVVVRRRVMLLDGEPIQLADSYYPAGLAAGTELASPAKLRGGTLATLERLGVSLARFRERVSVRTPTAKEAAALGLATGDQVIQQTRVTYNTDDCAVEVTDHVMGADRNVLIYDLPLYI
jgi:GntR family transcriptional regulator